MLNYRIIAKALGGLLWLEALLLGLCLLVGQWYGETNTSVWLIPIGICALLGLLGLLGGRRAHNNFGRRDGYMIVSSVWIIYSLIGMIPFLIDGHTDRVAVAFFETMSGFTTTGATAFSDVDALPHSILFWRSLTQWQGGLGIVVFTVALLPIFGGGASQIYNAETTGITHDRFLPRISDVAKCLWVVYFVETLLLVGLLWIGPMDFFDAVCHAFTCISTGGYSTRDASIAAFDSAYVEYVLSLFMFLGSLNLTLVYFAATGKPQRLFKDEEFRFFTFFIVVIAVITTIWLVLQEEYPSLEANFRQSLFTTLSLGSSTGYTAADITLWGPFFWMLALLLMFVNGCAGST